MIHDASLQASHTRSKSNNVKKLTDGDRYSYWATPDHIHSASIEIQFKNIKEFDLIQLRENIKLGQRIEKTTIEIMNEGQWKMLTSVTTVGANRLIHMDTPVKSNRLRIRFEAPVALCVSEIGIYKMK